MRWRASARPVWSGSGARSCLNPSVQGYAVVSLVCVGFLVTPLGHIGPSHGTQAISCDEDGIKLAPGLSYRLLGWLAGLSAFAQDPGQFNLIESLPNRDVALRFTSPAGGAWRWKRPGTWRTGKAGARSAARVRPPLGLGAPYQAHRFFRAVEVAAASALTGDHLATSRGDGRDPSDQPRDAGAGLEWAHDLR